MCSTHNERRLILRCMCVSVCVFTHSSLWLGVRKFMHPVVYSLEFSEDYHLLLKHYGIVLPGRHFSTFQGSEDLNSLSDPAT